ncbi:MAG TPA: glycosyltransferase family 2 protein [Candidatus Omnitrophota bacterium]|nr:glycosyltransferase family 2 protein [Candidatus Omnitrophota bacterium]HRZ14503.1 glycosyltransferase family 2 protein [Candidatus Omnitrophota bacterium]
MDPIVTPKISAVVMIYNEEKQIRACLETIRWVDEIVICDSYSTDRTVEICREYTDKIFQRRFDNFGAQKSWTLDKPGHEWVLFVEADERFTPELAREIRDRIGRGEGYDGYWMPFENYVLGRRMQSPFWEFKKIKLYRKGTGRWQERRVHARFILDGKAGELTHAVRHYPYERLGDFVRKSWRATTLEAQEIAAGNKAPGWTQLPKSFLGAGLTFARFYFSRGEYKNGWRGFVFSCFAAPQAFLTRIKAITFKVRGYGYRRAV